MSATAGVASTSDSFSPDGFGPPAVVLHPEAGGEPDSASAALRPAPRPPAHLPARLQIHCPTFNSRLAPPRLPR